METDNSELLDSDYDKRKVANQRNSLSSCGPKTPEGKKASSQNSSKYGFFSQKALLPGESWDEFISFSDHLMEEFQPRTSIELHILKKYIAIDWRLKRLPEIEAGIFARYGISLQGNPCGAAFALVNSVQTDNILNQLARYEATLHKNSFKCLDLLRSLRKEGWGAHSIRVSEARNFDPSSTSSDVKPTGLGANGNTDNQPSAE